MGLFVFLLAGLGAWVGLTRGQVEPEGDCAFTFNVPDSQLRAYCQQTVGSNNDELVAELRTEQAQLLEENKQLRKDVDSLRAEYEGMVATVKKLETETSSWREVLEWPQLDVLFQPDNSSLIIQESPSYTDCRAAFNSGQKKNGIYVLEPEAGQRPFFGFCEDGWTVMLRRFDGSVDFYRYWDEYMGGFGELSGEFWLGLEQIHLVSVSAPHYLWVEALGYNGKLYYAVYENFSLAGEAQSYTLNIGNMTESNYLDVMSELDGVDFSTRDVDNDQWGQNNCAEYYRGGWWLKNCGFDPNRRYCRAHGCMSWGDRPVKKIIMRIRPMDAGPPDKERKANVDRAEITLKPKKKKPKKHG